MNPSTEDILNAIEKINAANIFVLPNNKNIILAAQQAESLVEDKNITSVTYQKVDDNQKVIGYEADYNTVKDQLLETLGTGKNIIIGYTMTDENNYIKGGHEITIIGSRTDENGQLMFICNDTDDDNFTPIEYPASYLIPKIHHAGIPSDIADKTMQQTENWVLGLREFNEGK